MPDADPRSDLRQWYAVHHFDVEHWRELPRVVELIEKEARLRGGVLLRRKK